MGASVLKALLGLLMAGALLASSVVLYRARRGTATLLLIAGTASFLVVALAHVFEALRILPQFGWGQPASVGHYVDLLAAVLGVVLVAWGVLLLYFRASLSGRRSAHGNALSNNRWRGP